MNIITGKLYTIGKTTNNVKGSVDYMRGMLLQWFREKRENYTCEDIT